LKINNELGHKTARSCYQMFHASILRVDEYLGQVRSCTRYKIFTNVLSEVITNTYNQRAANKYQCQLQTIKIFY